MKLKKILTAASVTALIVTGGIIYAAGHIDGPAVTNKPAGNTDLHVFRSAPV